MIKQMSHKVKLAALAVAGIGLYYVIPITANLVGNAWQKYNAKSLIQETSKEVQRLEDCVRDCKSSVESNSFILMPSEKDNSERELIDSENKTIVLNNELEYARRAFGFKNFKDVREKLDSEFGMPKGQKRETLVDRAKAEEADMEKVKSYCLNKRNLKETNEKIEWELRERLKSPYWLEKTLEAPFSLAEIPEKHRWKVPVLTPELETALRKLPPELYNSLGVNLIAHQPALEHILQRGLGQSKQRGKVVYDSAFNTYRQVRPANDKLKDLPGGWYRAGRDDGKLTPEQHKALMEAQNKVMNLILDGDNSLKSLDNYLNELHTQYFVYVLSQSSKNTTFSHSRLVPNVSTDGDGNISVSLDTEHYNTDGKKFFYTLRTENPQGHKDEEVYVGQKDSEVTSSWRSWDYKQDETPRFVREWKRLHYDLQEIIKNKPWEQINPMIEPENLEEMPAYKRK